MKLQIQTGQDILNKIKFKAHHDQLRLLRHTYSNYDKVISDINWKETSKQFYYGIIIYYPHLTNSVKQWYDYKLSNFIR